MAPVRRSEPPHVIESVLGHAPPPLVRNYQVHNYLSERRLALQKLEDHMLKVVGKDADVIEERAEATE